MKKNLLLICVLASCFGIENAFSYTIASGNNCGTDCAWSLDDKGILTISGSGADGKGTIGTLVNVPWPNSEVKSIVINDGITGAAAYAFAWATKATDIVLSDAMTQIGHMAFYYTNAGGKINVIIPDSITYIGGKNGALTSASTTIICKGYQGTNEEETDCDKLQALLENTGFKGTFTYAGQEECSGLKYYWADNKCNRVPSEKSSCLASDYYHYNGMECVANNKGINYCSEKYLAKEGECIDSALGCGAGYKNMGGWCNRVRYTPAEAAAVANDDNTNMVTITFKK